MLWMLRAILIFAPLLFGPGAHAQEESSAENGGYGGKIFVLAPASPTSKILGPAVADLKRYLEIIVDRRFQIAQGVAEAGIALVLSHAPKAPQEAAQRLSGKGRDAFFIHGDDARLEIVANDEEGLVNGVYFYLEYLGVRWLLPGEKWTFAPKRRDIAFRGGRLLEPAFEWRDFAGTGGFFSWRWGGRYVGSQVTEKLLVQWRRRLRYSVEAGLAKAVGEAFVSDKTITPILERHPEYLAKIGGRFSPLYIEDRNGGRRLNETAKLNAGEPAAVELFCDWAVRNFRIWHNGRLPSDATISVEPSDGYGYGDNAVELPGDGSASDQTFFIANQCARKVRAEAADARVALLAYAGHAKPPSFALEPNVLVQLAPYAFQGMEPGKFIAQWKKKATKLALYDYWSIPDWTHDEPTFDYLGIGKKLRYWRDNNIRGINAETTYGAGAMGLGHYVAAHLMWDLGLNERTLVDEWYDRAFGPAKAPMRRMLERWAHSFQLTSAEVGTSFHDLAEAARLGAGDPAVAGRIDDYAGYLHYLRLRLEVANAPDPPSKSRSVMALVRHLLSVNETAMVHTTRIIDTESKAFPEVVAAFSLDQPAAPGLGWAGVHPLTHHDIEALVADGVRDYPRGDWTAKTFSGELKLVQPTPGPPPEGDAWGPIMPTVGDLDVFMRPRSDAGKILLRVNRQVDNEVTVFDARGRTVFEHTVRRAEANGAAAWDELRILAAQGLYKIHFHPTGGRAQGYFSFQAQKGVPLTMAFFLAPKPSPSPWLYFYVPRGLRKLVLFLPLGDPNGVFHFQLLRADGAPAAIEYRDARRTLEIEVPAGQDGRIWSMNRMVSPNDPPLLLNAPQAFSLSPDTLMVPSDAL